MLKVRLEVGPMRYGSGGVQQMELDQFKSGSRLDAKQFRSLRKAGDEKRSDRGNFTSLSFFTIRFIFQNSSGFCFRILRPSRILGPSCFDR